MLALILSARAEEIVLHVGAAVAERVLPMSAASEHTAARIELGAGPRWFQGFVVAKVGAHNAPPWYEREAGLAGDFFFANVGVGVRRPFAVVGPLRIIPHGELGMSWFDAPIESAYAEDLAAEFVLLYPTKSVGLWAQAGCDVGVSLFEDVVTAYAGLDVGYATNQGLGVLIAPRLGLSADF